jgi:hypothetical protein
MLQDRRHSNGLFSCETFGFVRGREIAKAYKPLEINDKPKLGRVRTPLRTIMMQDRRCTRRRKMRIGMHRLVILAAALPACGLVAGCNPPVKQISAPCNCQGYVTPANPVAENPRFIPPDGGEEHYAHARHNRSAHRHAGFYREHHGYRHGFEGSDEAYARYWSSTRVAISSYDYRSTSRVYSAGYSNGTLSGGGYAPGGFVDAAEHHESAWQDGYGRMHGGAHLSLGEFHTRMDPWHGYDIDCPDGNHHRYHYHH